MNNTNTTDSQPGLHHFGFVVSDISAGLEGFGRSLDAKWDGRIFEDPQQKVKVALLVTSPSDPLIELVEPATPDSPVQRFLTEQGGGLHHVCYQVHELERYIIDLKARRCMLIRHPKPAVAFAGRRIAWIRTGEKLLVELLEMPYAGPGGR